MRTSDLQELSDIPPGFKILEFAFEILSCLSSVSFRQDIMCLRSRVKLSHDWVSLSEMSPSLPVAVIASEDGRFTDHHGFDYKAIEHAAKRNREHPEKRKLGASTISQQTAKNVFLWPGRSWVRKGFDLEYAIRK